MIAVLGAFDGFHRGHGLLLERARAMALASGQEWGAVTFEPHPGIFMGIVKDVLFTSREREAIRKMLEVPQIVALKFDDELSRLSPCAFWSVLRKQIAVDGIVVGKDFRFGKGRSGDIDLLERYCAEAGVPFVALDILEHLGTKISSSFIRTHVKNGDCALAELELGYPYFIWAPVVHGLGRGAKLGFPTANLDVPHDKLLPADGVYAVAICLAGAWRPGALSVGRNPTFQDIDKTQVEVFVLDHEGDLYGEDLPVFFLERLRPQERYGDVERLIVQIRQDVERCRSVFDSRLAPQPFWLAGAPCALRAVPT